MSENIFENSIYIENRAQIKISGVEDVDNFDDFNISIQTNDGELVISGEGLKINKLDVESGELTIEGRFNSMFFNDKCKKEKTSFFGRVFS